MPARTEPRAVTAIALSLAMTLFTSGFAQAQALRWPDAIDIERALKDRPFPGADRLGAQPVPAPPRLPSSSAPAHTDIEAIARSGARIGSGAAPAPAASPVRIFITLEMPRASLQLLTDQAARSGATLVLRGLKANSMRETLAAVSTLIGERQVAWVIDPEAFTRYRVERAPTFVLTLAVPTAGPAGRDDPGPGCGTDCPTPAAFTSVAPIREVEKNLAKLQFSALAVGADGRNRTLISPFAQKTGRNTVSNSGSSGQFVGV